MSQRTRFALLLLALGGAAVAQALVKTHPWLSLVGFIVACALVVVRGRDKLALRTREPRHEGLVVPRTFWILSSVGLVLCALSGIAVAAAALPLVTHTLWIAGLLALGCAAVAADSDRSGYERPWNEVALLAVLILACGVLFGIHLASMPAEVHGDAAEVGIDALRLLDTRPFNLFRTSWFRLPILHALPTAVGLKLFGIDLIGLRATSALLAILTVVLTFELARRLWNVEVAILSAVLLATSRYFLHLARAGYHYVDTPCASIAVLLLFLTAWRERRLGAAVWCGIVLGLAVQTYYASRLIPVLLLATWLFWLWRSESARRGARVTVLLFTVMVAFATAAPMVGFYTHHWADLWQRTIDTSVFSPGAGQHLADGFPGQSLTHIIMQQLRDAALLFNATSDTSVQYGYRHPLLDPISAVFFVLGFAGLGAAATTRRAALLLIWIVVPVIVGAGLTIDAPFFPRISGVMPLVAITIALGISNLLTGLRATMTGTGLASRTIRRNTARTLRHGSGQAQARPPLGVAILVGSLSFVIIGSIAAHNLYDYFVDYAPHYRHGAAVEIAQWIRANGAGRTTYMVGGLPQFSIRHGTIRFITHGLATRDIKDLAGELRAGSLEPAGSRFIIMPNGAHEIRPLQNALGPMQVTAHRDRGTLLFYTAIPRVQLTNVSATLPFSTVQPPAKPPQQSPTRAKRQSEAPRWAKITFVLIGTLIVIAFVVLGRRSFITGPVVRLQTALPSLWSLMAPPRSGRRLPEPPRWLIVVALTVIVAIGTGLRVYHLAQLPAGFYCDEAGLGYNAWSILQTGRDETGARWPLFIWSFDTSYKNPVWLYSAIAPIATLGLNELAVRSTSAAYGSATIVALYFLGRVVLGGWGGLLAAGALAVCPWHIHFSRIAFELITFPFFFVWAVTCFVRSLQGRRWFPLAAFLFGYTLYTYAIAKMFVPLFLVGCVVLFRRELWARRRELLGAGIVLGLIALPLFVFDLQNSERAGHYFADTSVFSAHQPTAQLVIRIVAQYLSFFSPSFLFTHGDRVVRHAVQGHGELYLLFAPFLALGFIVAWRSRNPLHQLIVLWLLLYPVAASLMTEAPTASRGIIGVPALCLLIALGAETLWRMIPAVSRQPAAARTWRFLLVAGSLAALAVHVTHYWRLYSEQYPLYSAKYYTGFQYGHRQVIDYFRAHRDEYDLMVLTAHRSNQAQIFPLFYDRFPPRLFQQDPEGALRHEAKMQVGWLKEMERFEQYNRLLFAVTDDELDTIADYEERDRVIAPDGSPAFVLIDVYPGRDFVRSWIVGGPYPSDDDSPPPASAPDDPLPNPASGSGWRRVQSNDPEIDLNNLFSPDADEACAWAVNAVTSPVERTVRVRAGFDDAGEVWINGERLDLEIQHPPDAPLVDPHVGEAHLQAGRNIVAVRSCEIYGDWYFYLHFLESNGQPVRGLEWELR